MTAGYDADHYVPRLDLGADPFAVEFESDYFYSGAMRRQLLEQLVHFCRFSDQVVMLVGATGSGTSTLLDHAFPQLEPLIDCCDINAEEAKTPEQMLAAISEQLQLTVRQPETIMDILSNLNSSVLSEDEENQLVVAVDQAQYMALETFQLLGDLVRAANGSIRLLLVGEYQVEQLARLAGFDSEQIKLLELEPLNKSEIGDYLLGLLQSVGYAGELPLNDDQLVVLQEHSGGNFTEINLLAPSILAIEKLPVSSGFSLGIPIVHVAAVVVLALVLLIAAFYQTETEETLATDRSGQQIKDKVSVPVTLPVNKPSSNSEVIEAAQTVASKDSQTPLNLVDEVADIEQPELVEDVESVSGEVDRNRAALAAVDKKLVIASPAPTSQLLSSNQLPATVKPINKPASVTSSTKIVDQSSSVSKAKPVFEPVAKAPIVVAKPESQAKPKSKKPKLKAVVKISSIPAREQRLLSFVDSGYVLQLMGSIDEQRTRDFVKQYVSRLPITYFETRLKGKPWFVVVTGPYTDKPQARAGVGVLPAAISKLKPWPRSVASVQQDIRQNRGL